MRSSGILMHITSLPSPYGIGTMGKAAYEFVDFLHRAGQSYWQILPLTPTGYGNSPYQSCSSYAGNPYLIDLDLLVKDGLLKKQEIAAFFWGSEETRVDFGAIYRNRSQVLKLAFQRFTPDGEYEAFLQENPWIQDHCLFLAIKESQGGKPWLQWPQGLKTRKKAALDQARRELEQELSFQYFLQYVFFKQWQALRAYARERGICVIGDVPIYVPLDSADVWAAPKLFQLDENLNPRVVAGCPPDGFTADGQLWGNPIYDWPKHQATKFAWWIQRLEAAARLYDVIRIDHFRGLESYWSVPAGDKTARNGCWVKGPGQAFLQALHKAMPEQAFIAEDLGYLTEAVRQLRDQSGYPGMKVIEFAFDSREESDYLPHRYTPDSVCYTGTHDNVTLKQWFQEASPEDAACAKAYLGLNKEEGDIWGMIRGGMGSVSNLFIAQIQDYLGLGKEGRMNFPGTFSDENWTWRAKKGFASKKLADKIYAMTKRYGRI